MTQAAVQTVTVRVELFGGARIASGRREIEITVPESSGVPVLVLALAEACPELVGRVVKEDRSGLEESYTLNLNGVAFVSEGRLHLKSGDRLLLFSSQAGG